MRARFVNESIKHLTPRSEDEIDKITEHTFEEIADVLVDYEKFDDFLDAIEFVEKHREQVIEMLQDERDADEIADILMNGWEAGGNV